MDAQFGSTEFGGSVFAYDGRSQLYTPNPLPKSSYTLEISLNESESRSKDPRVFTVKIKQVSTVNIGNLKKFMEGTLNYTPFQAIAAFDIILRQFPSSSFKLLGRSQYHEKGCVSLPGPVDVWHGFFQSIRPSYGRLLLNVDIAATPFYKSGNLADVARKFCRGSGMSDSERRVLDRSLRGLKVQVEHTKFKRKYKINSFRPNPATHEMFEKDGDQVSVSEYFYRTYQIRLKYPDLPCVHVGKPEKNMFLPLELCSIVPGQRYSRKLDEEQTAAMIKITCVKPQDRMNRITKGINELSLTGNRILDGFGIKISEQPVQLNARVLDTPTLTYGDRSRDRTVTPQNGAWNLIGKQVKHGVTVNSWAVLSFGGRLPVRAIETFVVELVSTCSATGIQFSPNAREPPIIVAGENIEKSVMDAFRTAQETYNSRPQFILCILPNTGSHLYGEIKRIGDTVCGLPTQCMQSKHVGQAKKAYCANLALKINVKLGGTNVALGNQLVFIPESPTIVFGADVSHPPAGSGRASIAAVVASLDINMSQYASIVRTQDSRQEVIADLQAMTKSHLLSFYQSSKVKPKRIVYYRDGVGEGQFAQVAEAEIAAMKAACKELDPNYAPTITMIVVQKRHHTRFFPVDRGDRSGNVSPGTVIDTGITHPTQFDFYLCSHAGLQGTNRPTHYYVLFDENKFTADLLQTLSYRLCYTFARCTRSVSVVPPVYYAHLAAFRSKFHFKSSQEGSVTSGSDEAQGMFTPVKAGLDRTMYFI